MGGLIGKATNDKDGLISKEDKRCLPKRIASSIVAINGIESGYGFFCEITAPGFETGLYYMWRTDNNVYYHYILGSLSANNVKIKNGTIYIERNGVTINITCFHSINYTLSAVSSIPSDAVNGISK